VQQGGSQLADVTVVVHTEAGEHNLVVEVQAGDGGADRNDEEQDAATVRQNSAK
jgi:hypothetical protein